MESDTAGHLLVHSLVKAANRGVRVRILLDDTSTEGYDQIFALGCRARGWPGISFELGADPCIGERSRD
jgi:phosphatidylserine/phosphatidylglycerophosphate/cardiolipin synthase-like enzyme